MDAAKNTLQINWIELKPLLHERWGKITDDDLVHIDGNTEELIKILRKKYGYGKAQAVIEIENWLNNNSNP